MRVDFLIVGQGLAGSVLALELIEADRRVLVIDNGHRSAASRAAAGIVNPVTGKRLAPSWRVETLLPAALEYYLRWERRHGVTVFQPRRMRRYLTPRQRDRYWPRRLASGELNAYLADPAAAGPDSVFLDFEPAGYVDTALFLDTCAGFLASRDALRRSTFAGDELRIGRTEVTWCDVRADKIIFCEGYKAATNPYFDWLPFTPAKGEILTLNAPALTADTIRNNGNWLLPLGDGRARVGATYEWKRLDETPTAAARTELERAFTALSGEPAGEVLEHRAGVRSVLKDTKPVLGLHPGFDAVGIFNGLGSKGVLVAPHFARCLADHLVSGRPLDDEVDVRRNV